MAVTQDAACKSNGKAASFQGPSLFFGGPLSGGGGKMKQKERRRVYSYMIFVFLASLGGWVHHAEVYYKL